MRDSTFGIASGVTLVVGATGIYTLQGLLTRSGVIHHSWDVVGQICDRHAGGALFASLAGLRSALPLMI
jgi:hypothetical protein